MGRKFAERSSYHSVLNHRLIYSHMYTSIWISRAIDFYIYSFANRSASTLPLLFPLPLYQWMSFFPFVVPTSVSAFSVDLSQSVIVYASSSLSASPYDSIVATTASSLRAAGISVRILFFLLLYSKGPTILLLGTPSGYSEPAGVVSKRGENTFSGVVLLQPTWLSQHFC